MKSALFPSIAKGGEFGTKRGHRLTPIMGLIFIIIMICLAPLPCASAQWPMFHSSPSHSGIGPSNSTVGSQLLWRRATGNEVWSSPAVEGGGVYIGSSDGNVYALNASSGATIWTHSTGNEVRSSPAVAGGMVFVGSMDNSVYALSSADGSLVWSFATGNAVDSSPVVVNNTVYVGSLDGKIYALNATNGAMLWSHTTGSYIVSSPAIAGGVVYVGSMDHKMYALNASNGTMIWSFAAASGVYSSPAVVAGVVYFGSWDYSVYAVNASTGVMLWSFATGNQANGCPAVEGHTVYVGSRDGKVYALDASTGGETWNFTTGNGVSSSPAVANGVVYVGSDDGRLYALNSSNGAKIWSYQTGGAIVTSPAIVGDVVYFGSWDGYVYALGGPSAPSVLQEVWVPQPANTVEAIGVTVIATGGIAVIVSFLSNPLSVAGEQVAAKTEDLTPDTIKEWLEDVISSRRKTEVGKTGGSLLRPTGPEVLAYVTLVVLLAVAFSYVKVSSLDQIWALLPVFFGTSILVGIVQKYSSIVYLRRRGVWSEHRIWPLGFILFLLTTFAFKVPFSSPTRSAHQSTEATERLVGRAAALEILIGLAFVGLFSALLLGGFAAIGGAGLAICVLGSLSAIFPVKPMSGKDIFDYSRRRWAGLFVIVVAVFCVWLLLI